MGGSEGGGGLRPRKFVPIAALLSSGRNAHVVGPPPKRALPSMSTMLPDPSPPPGWLADVELNPASAAPPSRDGKLRAQWQRRCRARAGQRQFTRLPQHSPTLTSTSGRGQAQNETVDRRRPSGPESPRGSSQRLPPGRRNCHRLLQSSTGGRSWSGHAPPMGARG